MIIRKSFTFYCPMLLSLALAQQQLMILFKNHCDQQQILSLGRQIFRGSSKHFGGPFKHATQRQYEYIFFDIRPHTHVKRNMFIGVQYSRSRSGLSDNMKNSYLKVHLNTIHSEGHDKKTALSPHKCVPISVMQPEDFRHVHIFKDYVNN